MGGIDFFPPPHYARGQVFTFVKPSYTEWTLIEKLEQRSWRQDEADTSYGGFPSFARATFLVRKESIDREAFMRIYQQVPSKGTEFFPPEERANQAASSGNHAEFEAVRTFYEKKSPITPALLAYKEEIQDRQGLIPGGYVILFVFERVPGVPLAEDKILPGYGAPLHRFFREFDDDERKQIRQHFDEGYIKLQKLGWEPAYPWASHLIWDKSSTKLLVPYSIL